MLWYVVPIRPGFSCGTLNGFARGTLNRVFHCSIRSAAKHRCRLLGTGIIPAMFKRILGELGSSFVLCIGERVLERVLFPGLHLMPGRIVTPDPARADTIAALIAEAFGLMALIWLFVGSLYVIGWLYRRPLRWQVPPIITIMIVGLIFAGSFSIWYTMPTPPPQP